MQSSNDYERVELFLNARNLRDTDVFSKADPYVKVYFMSHTNSNLQPIGRTETINNNLNPNWNKTFQVDFIFETTQHIKFQVLDDDGQGSVDLIGSVQTTLGALAGAKNMTSVLTLMSEHKKESGKLVVRIEKLLESSQSLRMKWRGKKLMNTDSIFDFWDKSDPYLKFLKIREDNTFASVAQTEVIQNNLDPNWNPIEVPVNRLVSPQNQSFRVECWDFEEDGQEHQFIGAFFVTIDDIRALNGSSREFVLVNPKKSKPGKLLLESSSFVVTPSFVDYLKSGLQLNLVTAIDFTGSNGTPSSPDSLHYMNPVAPNQYQLTLQSVWNILGNYDSDQKIPAFGFGAKPRFPGGLTDAKVSHCFPLSGNPGHIEMNGFADLMQCYMHAIKHVQLAGPTYFAPILTEICKAAAQQKNSGSSTYIIALILTDGEIHDMALTKDTIVAAAELPLSIIIVGVGQADFGNMEALDGDNGLYHSNGRRCPRDIVQFVPFRNVGNNPGMLAQELLRELPGQVVGYMKYINKLPIIDNSK